VKDGTQPTRGGGLPERRKTRRTAPASRQMGGPTGRASASDEGRSGYGSESVRPYLRAQLRQKELLAEPRMVELPFTRKRNARF
jgi:hypothetical protein